MCLERIGVTLRGADIFLKIPMKHFARWPPGGQAVFGSLSLTTFAPSPPIF